MPSRILAFRPANVVERLEPRSRACVLSPRELLGPAASAGVVLPVVRAPIAAVARGALVAAQELRSTLGLALPGRTRIGPWFEAVARAADEVAAGLPVFLSAEIAIGGEGALEAERAAQEAWSLVDAGVTHLAFDVAAVAPGERARVLGDVAAGAAERGACVDVIVPLYEGPGSGSRAATMFEDLAASGATPDLASVRCPAPADDAEAHRQAVALARLSRAIGGVPVMRRGPVAPRILALLRGSPVKACEDGGAAAARALALVPAGAAAPEGGEAARESPLERAAAGLSQEDADRVEARAYVDAVEFLEELGARGSAAAIASALERRLESRE